MKLPNYENAIVSIDKLNDYLLSVNHTVGSSKARFFRSIGFNEGNSETFREALLDIARSNQIIKMETTAYGSNILSTVKLILQAVRRFFFVRFGSLKKNKKLLVL